MEGYEKPHAPDPPDPDEGLKIAIFGFWNSLTSQKKSPILNTCKTVSFSKELFQIKDK